LIDPLLKTLDIVTMPTDRAGDRAKLTLALAADTDPVWSPDGARVIFRSMEDARPALFTRRAHDPKAPIEGGTPAADMMPTDWRGDTVLVTSTDGLTSDIHAVTPSTGARTPVAATGFRETDARWSPDGRWVALVSDESGQPDVYAIRVRLKPDTTSAQPDTTSSRTRVSFAGGTKPRWSDDGRGVYFMRGSEILRADLQGDRFTSPRPVAVIPGLRDFDAGHRSGRLLALLASGPPPSAPAVIANWTTGLTDAQAIRR
jgi:Tol biopolymer transport system component